jgi:tetratricopeptide (TPR) repeat protein
MRCGPDCHRCLVGRELPKEKMAEMSRVYFRISMVFLLLVSLASACAQQPKSEMQVTTRSAKARAAFEEGMAKMETLHWDAALQSWRKAVQADPQFALAHILLAMLSRDPLEQFSERDKAMASQQNVGREEQLIIEWIGKASQGQWIPAIQAMNEAAAEFPQDKRLAWLTGLWLEGQRQSPRAIPFFERAIQLDPKFADPWNQVAYCYARTGNFDKAFADMKTYADLLPNEANPQDSLAEISRMAGRLEEALTHYRTSLKIDPGFIESQLGLGDTYALMGDEPRARAEYAGAIQKAPNKAQATQWMMQSAATYVREGNFSAADMAFREAARLAHDRNLGGLEAEAYRMMSLYQKDHAKAIDLLKKADASLSEGHQMPKATYEQEIALIMRSWTARLIQNHEMEQATAMLKQLEELSQYSPGGRVEFSYHGAAGTMLVAQGKYEEAVSQLEEDSQNPFSLQQLTIAYGKMGNKEDAGRTAQKLAGFYEPTMEQAVIVPEFRKSMMAMENTK